MEPPGRCSDWFAPPPSPPRAHAPGRHDKRRGGDFYLATSGDLHLAISEDFPMAMDTSSPAAVVYGGRPVRCAASTTRARGQAGAIVVTVPAGKRANLSSSARFVGGVVHGRTQLLRRVDPSRRVVPGRRTRARTVVGRGGSANTGPHPPRSSDLGGLTPRRVLVSSYSCTGLPVFLACAIGTPLSRHGRAPVLTVSASRS
jgi:hypothetical protein